ncbi:hypothetical protein RJ641_005430, partial [Dillenia turbinata]
PTWIFSKFAMENQDQNMRRTPYSDRGSSCSNHQTEGTIGWTALPQPLHLQDSIECLSEFSNSDVDGTPMCPEWYEELFFSPSTSRPPLSPSPMPRRRTLPMPRPRSRPSQPFARAMQQENIQPSPPSPPARLPPPHQWPQPTYLGNLQVHSYDPIHNRPIYAGPWVDSNIYPPPLGPGSARIAIGPPPPVGSCPFPPPHLPLPTLYQLLGFPPGPFLSPPTLGQGGGPFGVELQSTTFWRLLMKPCATGYYFTVHLHSME